MSLDSSSIELELADEGATARLGEDLALALSAGDCLALHGDLGAGKSTLARAFLRAMADDDDLEVPSPTFTLVQSYALRLPVAHFDLYRLGDASEMAELGLDDALENGIALIEWPERALDDLPGNRISLTFAFTGAGRRVRISGPQQKLQRIQRVLDIRHFLADHGYGEARRRHLTGDASSRAYEYIYPADGDRLILMDAPARPPGPIIADGKTYPQLVHLAENVEPFIAIAGLLKAHGFAAPDIIAEQADIGLLLIEDLGSELIVTSAGQPIEERYRASIACLAELHGQRFERDVDAGGGRRHHIADFDRVAIKTEVSLLLDWYLPSQRGAAASDAERADYNTVWDGLIDALEASEKTLLLRDFHSPNIIWRPQHEGLARIGLIDFQDAMIGPSAYDLASIVQDARVDIPDDLAHKLMDDYLSLRRRDPGFDEQNFLRAWSIMAAQRACKLTGIWVRLAKRDGKPGYMKHMPRTLRYLSTALRHEALLPLREWCAKVGIGATESVSSRP
ncbi:tRNA (adenosine(37)-N6)-threonylcarbamoyltransferase complex ATPase subunit type 1 TsaE [Rhizobium sp. RU36D]|uniref:tRNA (adenosine(37)-N6)-threonylcarbamoyltransferase complex ATPase subunit type 1 TsaE n=1 Tax=Rhizobium sp. RU36D TaxID=1907415 RepID=UPI0009D8EB2A|nr:tRNA (adenosine(37)-N6)-threonylcarbamoyltransferase complex ATPase subunit type 1 TsaE [Rhizobium sp. RU36D]SMC89435.1 hypothetical protein SAMN05880593_109155 [Rhizobium sp. RU36D]